MNIARKYRSAGHRFHLKVSGLKTLVTLVGFGLLVASVLRELRLPPRQRTWHGAVFGKVPYDLRPPTRERVEGAMWNPASSQVVVPTAFGVGWSVNLPALRSGLARSIT